jgi:phosphatidylserine decarboxylase
MKTKQGMRSTFQNEYNNMLFWTDEGYRFRVIQIAWFFARRIVPYLKLQDVVKQGDPIGHIKFGSQVSVILDNNFKVKVKVWDKVVDWETVLAVKK